MRQLARHESTRMGVTGRVLSGSSPVPGSRGRRAVTWTARSRQKVGEAGARANCRYTLYMVRGKGSIRQEQRRREMPANPVSCHLITWGGDYKTGLREAAELGFHACETFTHQALEYEDRVEEFRALLNNHNMRLSALYGGGRFSDPARRDEVVAYNTRVARFLAALGVERIVFGPAGPRTPGGTTDDELREAARTIDAAARACHELGVLACVHPHPDTEI